MDAKNQSIGSVTFFTNVSTEQQYLFDDALNELISISLVQWLKQELTRIFDDDQIIIIAHTTKTGCI